jgi:hypothetical protein
MREIRQSGSVEGAAGNRGPYSDHSLSPSIVTSDVTHNISSRGTKLSDRSCVFSRSNWRRSGGVVAKILAPNSEHLWEKTANQLRQS